MATQQFTATGNDQFGAALGQPTFTWSTTAGSIDNGGLFTAPALRSRHGDGRPAALSGSGW